MTGVRGAQIRAALDYRRSLAGKRYRTDENALAELDSLLAALERAERDNEQWRQRISELQVTDTTADQSAIRRVDELNALLAASEEHTRFHEARAVRAEQERDRIKDALTQIARRGPVFDAKGTWSKEVCRIAGAALSVEAETRAKERTDALTTLRDAWNAHMDTCPQHAALPILPAPSQADLEAWRNAPSNTASAVVGEQPQP